MIMYQVTKYKESKQLVSKKKLINTFKDNVKMRLPEE